MCSNKTLQCGACGKEVAKRIKKCIHSGKVHRRLIGRYKVLTLVLIVVLICFIGSACDGGNEKRVEPAASSIITTNPQKKEDAIPANSSKETLSQKNAEKSAKNYLSFSAFSRSGLIAQLEFEGFSTGDATYGVDGLNANWKEQALKSARNYLSFSAFSRSGLIAQLEYEGFSKEEATYAVNKIGL